MKLGCLVLVSVLLGVANPLAASEADFATFESGAPMFLGCNYWASHAGVTRRVRCADRNIGLTEHPLPTGETVVVAINYAPQSVTCAIEGADDGRVLRGVRKNGVWTIPANDAVVFYVK